MTEYILGDICSISSGGTPKRSNESFYYPPVIPWVKVGDLGKEIYMSETEEYISNEGLSSIGNRTFPSGTILLAMYGATLGKTGIADIELSANQAVLGINSLDKRILSNSYLKYWLDFNIEMLQFKGKGGTYKNLSKKFVSSLKIKLPEINQQHRVVQRFEKIQQLIQKRNQTIELLDEYIHSVFLEMFGDPVVNDKKWETIPVQDSVNQIVSGWSAKSLQRSKLENELGVLKISSVTTGFFDPSEHKAIPKLQKSKDLVFPEAGDFLMTRANTKDKVGAIAIIYEDYDDVFLSDKIWKVDIKKDKTIPIYLKMVFGHEGFRKKFVRQVASPSGSMVNISQRKFLSYYFPNPSMNMQLMFKSTYDKYLHQREQLHKSKELIEELFQSLIHQTFSPQKDKTDEIEQLINDDFLIRDFFETIDKSDFQSLEQYDIELKRLRKVLKRTQERKDEEHKKNKRFEKGIIQVLDGKKVQLRINQDYINEQLDEATAAQN